MFITISREYGAGGSVVARMVADTLRWRLVDNQVVEEVARRAGLTTDDVARREERGPSFIERLSRALASATPELLGAEAVQPPEAEESRLVKLTEQVVRDACADGHVVLVGRAAVALLASREDALHVRVVAEAEHRSLVIMDRLGIEKEEAVRRIKEVDANRARYHRIWYDRDWYDPRNYHLTVNTGLLGLDRSAELVVTAAAPLVRGGGE
jgi:cytidylate kinase